MLSESERQTLLEDLELMETHVAECGELFGTMGCIPLDKQQILHRELHALREKALRWTEFAAKAETKNKRA